MQKTFYITVGVSKTTGFGAMVLRELYNIAYAVKCGYIPIVDLKHHNNQYFKDNREYKDNVWEYYFKQPFDFGLEDIKDDDKVIISTEQDFCPLADRFEEAPLSFPKYIIEDFKTGKIKNELGKYLKFNDETFNFIQKKCDEILKGEKDVLGVLLRGTDYTKRQSYSEFVQPEINDVIKDVKKLIAEGKFKKIYLATEDNEIFNKFKKAFGSLLLDNTQYMYTNYDKTKFLSEIKVNRENHNYRLGLEYLASLYILSKCKGFLGGMAGGTRITYLLSDNWKYLKIYDLGRYGIYNSTFEKLFSIKNVATKKGNHKVFTFFGIKFKINLMR